MTMSHTPVLLLSTLLLIAPLHAQEPGVPAALPSEYSEAEGGSASVPAAIPDPELAAPDAPLDDGAPAVEGPAAAPAPAPASLLDPQASAPVTSRDPQVLEYEIHRLLAVAGVQADAREVPPSTRVDLYLRQTGLAAGRVSLLTIAIDGAAPQAVTLDPAVPAALNTRADALRVMRRALAAGPHQLQVSVTLAATDGSEEPPRSVTADLSFEQTGEPLAFAAVLDPGLIGAPTLSIQRLSADPDRGSGLFGFHLDALSLSGGKRYHPGDDDDPSLGHARQLLRIGDSRGALIELLSIAERLRRPDGSLPELESAYWLETARLLRAEGLLDRAQTICDELTPRRDIRSELAVERLALGEARLAAGDLAGAERQLALAQTHLPEFRLPDWRQATGMLQLAQRKSDEARRTLKTSTPESIEAFRYMSASVESVRATAYSRYNLAIATLRSGDADTALSWLDLLGRTQSDDPELLSLRDKANLALGWHFLERKQGRTAMGVLGRIRSEGLLSNRALLGMGWAQLAPAGERLPRVSLNQSRNRAPNPVDDLPAPVRASLERLRVLEPEVSGSWIGPSSFERDDPPKDRRDGLNKALAIWTLLAERDERDPAVQEARLAVAYAHDQLRDSGTARAKYREAVDTLRRIDEAIAAESAYVADGELRRALLSVARHQRLFETLDRLHLPPDSTTFALYAKLDRLMQRNRLQQALLDARERLSAPAAVGEAFTPPAELIARLGSFESWLNRQRNALADDAVGTIGTRLATRRDTTREYLKTALLSAARLEDTPDLDSRASEPACLDADCAP